MAQPTGRRRPVIMAIILLDHISGLLGGIFRQFGGEFRPLRIG
jgi:hypothetical protein